MAYPFYKQPTYARRPTSREMIFYLNQIPTEILTETQLKEIRISLIRSYPYDHKNICGNVKHKFPKYRFDFSNEQMDCSYQNVLKFYFIYALKIKSETQIYELPKAENLEPDINSAA